MDELMEKRGFQDATVVVAVTVVRDAWNSICAFGALFSVCFMRTPSLYTSTANMTDVPSVFWRFTTTGPSVVDIW